MSHLGFPKDNGFESFIEMKVEELSDLFSRWHRGRRQSWSDLSGCKCCS